MGKETGISELKEALKESLAMMSSFHLVAFINEKPEDVPPEVRCTDERIEHCTGCAAANQYRKADEILKRATKVWRG
jgi:uncharacterized protein (DUF169 family)